MFFLLGYFLLPFLEQIQQNKYVGASAMMGVLVLVALLLSRYTFEQLKDHVSEAQTIATLIFNQDVLDGVVDVEDDKARIDGLAFESGPVMVEVKLKGQTIVAPLAPEAYQELPVDKIARLEAAFANNQKVKVLLSDGTIAETHAQYAKWTFIRRWMSARQLCRTGGIPNPCSVKFMPRSVSSWVWQPSIP